MSALPPQADIRWGASYVRFGPEAFVRRLLNHLVGDLLEMQRPVEAHSLGGLHIDHQLELSWLHNREVGRLRPLKYFSDVNAGLVIRIFLPAAVAHQAAGFWKFA